MQVNRFYGHKPDPQEFVVADLAARNARELVAGVSVMASVDFRELCLPIEDQIATQSCTGFAIGSAIELCAIIAGRPIGKVSKLAIYTGGRALETSHPLALFDEGAIPRLVMAACMDPEMSAIVPDRAWQFDARFVNYRLPLDVYQKSDGVRIDYHRIGGSGWSRIETAQRALSIGRPVVFAMEVDQAYDDLSSSIPYKGGGPSKGSHYQCIVGYDESGFIVRNSWGEHWGEGGYSWIEPEFIGSDKCRDFYVIDAAPERLAAA